MKISHQTILLFGISLLTFSCETAIDKENVDKYYSSIVIMTEKQDASYKKFVSTFKTLIDKANVSEGRRLDSTDLATMTNSYKVFIYGLKSDKKMLQNLKEVDQEINLKYNIEKHISFVDSALQAFMPKVFHYLKISLDSADNKFWQEFDSLKIVTETEQNQRKKIDELAEKFRQKYP